MENNEKKNWTKEEIEEHGRKFREESDKAAEKLQKETIDKLLWGDLIDKLIAHHPFPKENRKDI